MNKFFKRITAVVVLAMLTFMVACTQTFYDGNESYVPTPTPSATQTPTATPTPSVIVTPITVPTAGNNVLSYNGNEQVYLPYGVDLGVVTVSGNVATNAGTYTATLSIKNKTAYKWDDDTTADKTFKWTINKAEVPAPTLGVNTVDYTGGNVKYLPNGFDSTTMVISNNVKVDMGSYTATVTLKDADNYKWADNATGGKDFSWNILRTLGLLSTGDNIKEYTGDTYTYLPQGFDSSIMEISSNTGSNAGEYKAIVSLKDTTNLKWADGTTTPKEFVWNITAREISIPTIGSNSFEYDNGATITYTPVGFNPTYMTITGNTGSAINTYTCTVSLKDKVNYAWAGGITADQTFTWAITRGNLINVTVPTVGTNKFDFTGASVTYLPDGFDSDTMEITGNTASAKGVHTAQVTLKNAEEYKWADNSSAAKNFQYTISIKGTDGNFYDASENLDMSKTFFIGTYVGVSPQLKTYSGTGFNATVASSRTLTFAEIVEYYRIMKASGITCASVGYDSDEANIEWQRTMLKAAEIVGIKQMIKDPSIDVILQNSALSESQKIAQVQARSERYYSYYDSFYGLQVKDEPDQAQLNQLAANQNIYKKAMPNHCYFVNLLPYMPFGALDGSAYTTYVDTWANTTANFVCYDHYALHQGTGLATDFFRHMEQFDYLARRDGKNKQAWTYLQSTGYSSSHRRPERLADIAWQVYGAIAMGMEGFLWFTYFSCPPNDGAITFTEAVINRDGTKSAVYDWLSKVNNEVLMFDEALMSYNRLGVLTYGSSSNVNNLTGISLLGSHSKVAISSASCPVLCAVYQNGDKYAILVMNSDNPATASAATVTLSLPGATKLTVYNNGTKTTPSINGSYTVSLYAGGGAFIELQ